MSYEASSEMKTHMRMQTRPLRYGVVVVRSGQKLITSIRLE